ncbi:ABC transporter substrate-binding protein [Breoghania sp.]|uniref:ABC transporter substrate-binding protein n=1 Tax=Breoghania sp. TaxID=2065378 RepID=UPI002AAB6A52|nr:ABC transporter substrate-binding protein [Breoghania sp.]
MKKLVLAALIAVAGAMAPGLSHAEIVVKDVLGRERTLEGPAQRVILGFYFEDFLAITGEGAYDRVVGISKSAWHDWRNSQWKAYSAVIPRIEELEDVGGLGATGFSLEKAIALNADVAILPVSTFNALGEAAERLEAAGIPIIVADYNAQTVEKHVASTLAIGAVMGTPERARQLADEYVAAVKDIEARVSKALEGGREPVRAYVELGKKGPGEYDRSFADGYMWGGMIDLAGGRNIAGHVIERSAPLAPEYVLDQNPEVVFIAGSYWVDGGDAVVMGFGVDENRTRERLNAYAGRAGWQNIDAVKNSRMYAIYHGGARTLHDYAALQYLAKAMYPEAFEDVDPGETLRTYYERYLPIAADGAFMVGQGE